MYLVQQPWEMAKSVQTPPGRGPSALLSRVARHRALYFSLSLLTPVRRSRMEPASRALNKYHSTEVMRASAARFSSRRRRSRGLLLNHTIFCVLYCMPVCTNSRIARYSLTRRFSRIDKSFLSLSWNSNKYLLCYSVCSIRCCFFCGRLARVVARAEFETG